MFVSDVMASPSTRQCNLRSTKQGTLHLPIQLQLSPVSDTDSKFLSDNTAHNWQVTDLDLPLMKPIQGRIQLLCRVGVHIE